jgi:hypothetical protein
LDPALAKYRKRAIVDDLKMAVAPAVICKKEHKFASTSDQDLEIFW